MNEAVLRKAERELEPARDGSIRQHGLSHAPGEVRERGPLGSEDRPEEAMVGYRGGVDAVKSSQPSSRRDHRMPARRALNNT